MTALNSGDTAGTTGAPVSGPQARPRGGDDLFANFRDFWHGYDAGAEPGERGGIEMYRSGVGGPLYNGVLRVTPGVGLAAAYEEATAWFAGLPATWWVGPDSDPRTSVFLRGQGLIPETEAMTVMEIDLEEVDAVRHPTGLTIRRVPDSEDITPWVRAYAPSMGVAPAALGTLAQRHAGRYDETGSFVRFEARDGDRIVGTSALLDRRGVAGVYIVSTAEPYRGRGLGTALTAAALLVGRERGLDRGTLQTATAAALYARMGFRAVAEYRMFSFNGRTGP
ncbi:GNAT family N-acetyltransferase [Streptomyces sp. NPDC049936]|uniref:GNAT family N-acetyltransferase n=1 Tax=Streptomyces sp. NPDC049936 TaxID=3365599 RepID=UPI0037997647